MTTITEAIALLKKEGYLVKKLGEKEAMIQSIGEMYEKLSNEGKRKVTEYVCMIAYCEKNKERFTRFRMLFK